MRFAVGEPFEADELQHFADLLGDLRFRHPVLLEAERDVVEYAEMRKQRIALEHHIDRPPVGRDADDVLAGEQNAASVGRLETREHAQQRRLAATGRSEQGKKLAFVDVETEIRDCDRIRIALAHGVKAHDGLGVRIGPGGKTTSHGEFRNRVAGCSLLRMEGMRINRNLSNRED